MNGLLYQVDEGRISPAGRIPFFAALTVSALALLSSTGCAQSKPSDFEQLLPRGRIAAISQPTYVSADDAEIGDDSPVLGIVIDEVPIAFSLNLLNQHEVVNDSVGETNFAAVW